MRDVFGGNVRIVEHGEGMVEVDGRGHDGTEKGKKMSYEDLNFYFIVFLNRLCGGHDLRSRILHDGLTKLQFILFRFGEEDSG